MIFIQIILVLAFLIIGVNFIRSRGTSRTNAFKKVALILFIVLAVVATLFPNLLAKAAHLVGVGRGADLLLYGLAVVVIFQLLNSYTKGKEEERRFVRLARKVAILEAVEQNKR